MQSAPRAVIPGVARPPRQREGSMNSRGKPSSRILSYFADPSNHNRVVSLSEVARAVDHPEDRVQTTIAILMKKKLIPGIEVKMRGQAWIVSSPGPRSSEPAPAAIEESQRVQPPKKVRTRPEARSVVEVKTQTPVGDPKLVSFLEIGQMVDRSESAGGLPGILGAKLYRRVVRDQTTGQLYKLVEL